MKIKVNLIILVNTIMLLACTPSVPTCSDPEVVSTVEVIYYKQMPYLKSLSMSFKVGTIRTINTNSTTGAHECAATLNLIAGEASRPIPIKYKVEKLDDTGETYISIIK